MVAVLPNILEIEVSMNYKYLEGGGHGTFEFLSEYLSE
jgi:hypothetical protein